jgi:4-aminobutyrate aminotransferase
MPTRPQAQEASLRSEGDINLSPHRQAWLDEAIDPATRRLLDEDARYFLHQSLSTPCLNVLTACDGLYLEDLQGRRYMDFHGNYLHQLGFGHPTVQAAIVEQMASLSFCTRRYTNQVAIDLARTLVELAPGDLSRVLFCPSGTGAIGMALKLARVATGRHKVISMWDAFHGASLDAISVGGEQAFRRDIGPLLPGVEHVPPPDEYRCLWECSSRGGCDLKCANYIDYVLDKEGDIAAVIAEPVRSIPYIPRPAYWQRVRAACDRHGALLIFDEIPHALGRTGKMFTCENFTVTPDILVLGKGLGGGILPLAAILAREGLNVAAAHALGHYTHEKNPVLCAAALATIKTLQAEGLLENAHIQGEYALARMRAMQPNHPLIGDVRGLGLLMGMELVEDREARTRADEAAEQVMYAALRRGLSFKLTMGNTISLVPPLTITRQQMDEALDILDAALYEVEATIKRTSQHTNAVA